MHRHGIVHRDVKTENVLLAGHGQVCVIDFGTAKDLIQTDLNGPEFVGSPYFMSPEAVSGTSGMEEAKETVARGEVGPCMTFLKIKRGNSMRPAGIVDDKRGI